MLCIEMTTDYNESKAIQPEVAPRILFALYLGGSKIEGVRGMK